MGDSVVLIWCCKTPRGWLRFTALFKLEYGRRVTRHGWVKDRGIECEYPVGHYQLRTYEGGKQKYKTLDECNPRDVVLALEVAQRRAKTAPGQHRSLAILRNAADAYIKDREHSKAFEAAEQARSVLNEFIPLCKTVTFVRSITSDHVKAFHVALRKRGCKERTVANKHARLKSFFRFCKLDVSFMPKPPKYEKKLPTIYSSAETKAIRAAADPYMRLVIEMALMLGLRDQELVYSRWLDVDWDHKVFRVQGKPELGFNVKDMEQREVPIPSELLNRLAAWKSGHASTKLILGTERDTPNSHLLRSLKRLAKRAALNCGECRGCKKETIQECEKWTLHKFRRTYLTTLLRNNVDLETVRSYAGHSDLASTMRYLRHASAKDMQDKVNAIKW